MADFLGVNISHADRVVFPDAGCTKGDVAAYYARVGERMLELAGRADIPVGAGRDMPMLQDVGAHYEFLAARSAEFENSFMEYTLPDAILRFRQGFGRLIRRASDRGVVLLLDSRIWQKRYGQAFLEALPACTVRRASMANLGEEVDLWLNKE